MRKLVFILYHLMIHQTLSEPIIVLLPNVNVNRLQLMMLLELANAMLAFSATCYNTF